MLGGRDSRLSEIAENGINPLGRVGSRRVGFQSGIVLKCDGGGVGHDRVFRKRNRGGILGKPAVIGVFKNGVREDNVV